MCNAQQGTKDVLEVYVNDEPQRHNQGFFENIEQEMVAALLYTGKVPNR